MTLQIPLNEETEARLRALAEATGKDVPVLVAEAIAEKLAESEPEPEEAARPRPRTAQQWIAELRAWAASHPRLDSIADDSRESIYAGRGE